MSQTRVLGGGGGHPGGARTPTMCLFFTCPLQTSPHRQVTQQSVLRLQKLSIIELTSELTFNQYIFWGKEVRVSSFVQLSQYFAWSSPSIPSASNITRMSNTPSTLSIPTEIRSIPSHPISPSISVPMITCRCIPSYTTTIRRQFKPLVNNDFTDFNGGGGIHLRSCQ